MNAIEQYRSLSEKYEKDKQSGGNKKFLDHIVELMSDDSFRQFFDNYFNDFDDVRTVLMFMKSYQFVEKEYVKRGLKTDKEGMRKILFRMINDANIRSHMVASINGFMDNQALLEMAEPLLAIDDGSSR